MHTERITIVIGYIHIYKRKYTSYVSSAIWSTKNKVLREEVIKLEKSGIFNSVENYLFAGEKVREAIRTLCNVML